MQATLCQKRTPMRLNPLERWLILPLLSLGASAALAIEPSNVHIEFVHPERFSDFRIQGRQQTQSASIFRDRVSAYLSPNVARRFPNSTLTLKFTDIDLAGRLEPSRIRKFTNVRFDRNVASPLRLFFDYTLINSKGRVFSSGSESLVVGDYLYRYAYYPNIEQTQTLFYEKVTLNRWLDYLAPSGPIVRLMMVLAPGAKLTVESANRCLRPRR
jgi:Protein of unknown function (DUF3016)